MDFKCWNNSGGYIIKIISLSLLNNRLSSNCKCSIKNLRDMFGINGLCYLKLLDGEIHHWVDAGMWFWLLLEVRLTSQTLCLIWDNQIQIYK